jgi:hypothetical protein
MDVPSAFCRTRTLPLCLLLGGSHGAKARLSTMSITEDSGEATASVLAVALWGVG